MLAGNVDTPGVFLNASAVLERQLTAFTLDCWVRELGEKAKVPAKLNDALSRGAQPDAEQVSVSVAHLHRPEPGDAAGRVR